MSSAWSGATLRSSLVRTAKALFASADRNSKGTRTNKSEQRHQTAAKSNGNKRLRGYVHEHKNQHRRGETSPPAS